VGDEDYDSEGLDEFIVNDDGPGGGAGGAAPDAAARAAARRKAAAARRGVMGSLYGATGDQLRNFEEIFGAGARVGMLAAAGGGLAGAFGDDDDDGGGAVLPTPTGGSGGAGKVNLSALYSDDEDDDAYGGGAKAAASDDEDDDAGSDAEGGAAARKQRAAASKAARAADAAKRALLAAVYEPTVLAAKLATASDAAIREADVPERLQTLLRVRRARRARIAAVAKAGPPLSGPGVAHEMATRAGTATRDDEVKWIALRLTEGASLSCVVSPDWDTPLAVAAAGPVRRAGAAHAASAAATPEDVSPAVAFILASIYDRGWEVPYLWGYHRGHLHPNMTLAHVWAVVDLDDAWTRTSARRVAVGVAVDRAVEAGVADDDLAAAVRDALVNAQGERGVEDAAAYAARKLAGAVAVKTADGLLPSSGSGVNDSLFGLGGGGSQPASSSSGAAPALGGGAHRHDLYTLALGTEVRHVAGRMFMPPEQLAANARAQTAIHSPPEPPGGTDSSDALEALAFEALG
jgi:hypothetical protein